MNLRTVLAAAIATAAVAAPTAGAADLRPPELPDLNCGIVSCTYKYEELIRDTRDGVQECVDGAVRAIGYIVQGTPQPQECSI